MISMMAIGARIIMNIAGIGIGLALSVATEFQETHRHSQSRNLSDSVASGATHEDQRNGREIPNLAFRRILRRMARRFAADAELPAGRAGFGLPASQRKAKQLKKTLCALCVSSEAGGEFLS